MGGEGVEEWVRERVRCGALGNVPKLSSAEPDIDNMNQRSISLSISPSTSLSREGGGGGRTSTTRHMK